MHSMLTDRVCQKALLGQVRNSLKRAIQYIQIVPHKYCFTNANLSTICTDIVEVPRYFRGLLLEGVELALHHVEEDRYGGAA